VLVDLSAHTSVKDRLSVMAAQPAPVQVTAIGYPNTTGLTRIQWRLTDSIADPPNASDHLYSERLYRLDPCFLSYTPPVAAPALEERNPAAPFTFGCFNSLAKLSERVIRNWARLLRRLPEARLLLKCREFADPAVRRATLERFVKAGALVSQLLLIPPTAAFADHLATYAQVDLALDPFPYNGTTTTCEALWLGVPVVVLAGDSHVSRTGSSLLPAASLQDFVTASEEEYLDLSVKTYADRRALGVLRMEMRRRLVSSPLLDGAGYVRRFENWLREIA